MMKKYLAALFILFGAGANANSMALNQDKGKKVPIVVYTPFNFYNNLMDSFKFTEVQDYFVVSDKEIYVYDSRYGTGYYRGEYHSRKLRLQNNYLNIPAFRKVILENDSCFFFSPTQFTKYDNRFLGIKNGPNLRFIDVYGRYYSSLEELFTKGLGLESLEDFYDKYLKEVETSLYTLKFNNYIYKVQKEADAISILKDDFNFKYFKDSSIDLALSNFIGYLQSAESVDNDVLNRLESDLKKYFSSSDRGGRFNDLFSKYRASAGYSKDDYVPLMLENIAPVLKKNLPEAVYSRFMKRSEIHHSKTIAAYGYLSRKYRKTIFGDIVRSGEIDYCKIVGYLTQNVIFK